jgi:tRNA/rRNA methyltransferase
MPGAGTDKTKRWLATPAPVVVLVEPQLGENIGAAARAMANFGLSRLRIVKPLQGWPNERAKVMAAGADRILESAELYDSMSAAVADCSFVLATTARTHDQAKPVVSAEQAAAEIAPRIEGGETVALVFGRERNGLENHEVGLADRILTLPVNPAFASLNLAQAVVIVAYEWFKRAHGDLPLEETHKSPPAPRQQLEAFFADLERELEKAEFFRPEEKRNVMRINLRNIFLRTELTQQDIRTLHGVVTAIVYGRKGPARGGVLDSEEATRLRELIAEHGAGEREPGERSPVRGLARLLRRNPTEAERILWQALTTDRRFAGRGFKRQVPVGPHIVDFVSFPLRCVIDLVPAGEPDGAQKNRGEKRQWLSEHGYHFVPVKGAEIEQNLNAALQTLSAALPAD